MVSRREFSELTRVQIPAALHLMRLGYTYLPHNGKEIMGRAVSYTHLTLPTNREV